MARARVGQVYAEWHGDHWDIRFDLPDGTKSKRACTPAPAISARATEEQKKRARVLACEEAKTEARRLKAIAWRNGYTLARDELVEEGETVEEWSDRWWAARRARGMQVDADISRFGKWCLSVPVTGGLFGDLPIAAVGRAHIEDLVTHLDTQVRAEVIGWKTAANAWGLISKAFSDACEDKDRKVRVLTENPTANVRGPDRGQRKAKAWLHPAEVLKVLSNAEESLSARRAIALNVYLYTRPGELRALTWADVDLEAGTVNVERSLLRSGEEKGTKTDEPRTVPIEPSLVPLLAAMRETAGGDRAEGPITELRADTSLADVLRAVLQRAGVTRAALFQSTKTRKQVTWYDLRATGITWRAIRGDNPIAIMTHAGHRDFHTTQGYIRAAEAMTNRKAFGDVFPRLPSELFERGEEPPRGPLESRPAKPTNERNPLQTQWVDRDSNPGPTD